MLTPAESSYNANTKVGRLLNALLLCCGTVSPHCYTVMDVREDETFYKHLSDAFWQLMSDPRKAHEHAVAPLNNQRDVIVPGQMLVDDNTQDLDTLFWSCYFDGEISR